MFVFAVNILVLPSDSDTAALGVNQPGCEFCRIKPQPSLSEMETQTDWAVNPSPTCLCCLRLLQGTGVGGRANILAELFA